MKVVHDQEALLNCFREFDRDQVIANKEISFPLKITAPVSWVEPSGHRCYLLFPITTSEIPVGVVFQRGSVVADATPKMCEWCQRVQAGTQVGLLTTFTHANKSVGIYLCRDLSCTRKMEQAPGVHDMRETIGTQSKMDRLYGRMERFIRRNII